MARRGVVCGGCLLVDNNYEIDHWPAEETVAQILSHDPQGGGPAFNLPVDLARLGASFPLAAIGAVGNDEAGRLIRDQYHAHHIDTSRLKVRSDAPTSTTEVMSVRTTGKRTFFHNQGTNALLVPEDFDFSGDNRADGPKFLHLGAPGLHRKLDSASGNDVNGWVTILKAAHKAGLKTNLEMVSVETETLHRLVRPCLAHLDTLIINDFEAGALAGIETVREGTTQIAATKRAADVLLAHSSLDLVVIHFPQGCVAATRGGNTFTKPSVRVPPAEIKGANGAGDAFAAGVVFGVHEEWELEKALSLGFAAAAAALRSVSTTGSVVPYRDCLALADHWGWRDPLEP